MTQNNLACEWQLYHLIWWKILDFLCSFQSPSESNQLIIYIYIYIYIYFKEPPDIMYNYIDILYKFH